MAFEELPNPPSYTQSIMLEACLLALLDIAAAVMNYQPWQIDRFHMCGYLYGSVRVPVLSILHSIQQLVNKPVQISWLTNTTFLQTDFMGWWLTTAHPLTNSGRRASPWRQQRRWQDSVL